MRSVPQKNATRLGKMISELLSVKGNLEVPFQTVITGTYGYIAAAILLVIIVIILIFREWDYHTEANVRTKTNAYIKVWEKEYGAAGSNRKSLVEYVNELLQQKKMTPAQRCLSNFYIMTANGAAIFQPGDGGSIPIASIDALSYVMRAGCRGFIFDVQEPLDDRGKPYIYVRDPNPSLPWRMISMNRIPLRDAVNRLRVEAFGEGARSLKKDPHVLLKNTQDPIFIYVRFARDHLPSFYNAVADVLEAAFRDYRLDYTWAAGRRSSDFYTTDIQEFMGRAVILCNKKASGTRLEDMINIFPVSGVEDYYTTEKLRGLTSDEISAKRPVIQQHLLAAFDILGTPEANNNSIDWKRAHDFGIQMVGLNWFKKGPALKGYRDAFGEYSFKIKPEAMRYSVRTAEAAKKPGQDANMRGGRVEVPALTLRI